MYVPVVIFCAGNATSKESQCDCPAACNVTTYNADLSYAALSRDGINSLLSDDGDEIQKKHVAAKELQHRLEFSSISDTLQKLNQIDTTVAQFNQFWTSKITSIETSLIYRVEKALISAVHMANEDVNSLFANTIKYMNYYSEHLTQERQLLDDMLRAGRYLIADAMHPIIIAWNDPWPPKKNTTETSVKSLEQMWVLAEKVIQFMQYYGNVTEFKRPSQPTYDDEYGVDYFFPSFAVKEQNHHKVCTTVDKVLQRYSSILHDLQHKMSINIAFYYSFDDLFWDIDEGDHYYLDKLSEEYDILRIYLHPSKPSDLLVTWNDLQRNVSLCLNEYGVYLTRVQDWLQYPLAYISRYVSEPTLWKCNCGK